MEGVGKRLNIGQIFMAPVNKIPFVEKEKDRALKSRNKTISFENKLEIYQ